MLFAIDIGNTNIHLGMFEGDTLSNTFDISTKNEHSSSEYSMIFKLVLKEHGYDLTSIEGAIVSCVVPKINKLVREALEKITNAPIISVGPGIKTGFSIRLDDPAELGADLVANTASAIKEVGYPCIIVDFGTATTVSVVNEKKEFVGCSIMPGIQMSLDALHNTGLLPSVSTDILVNSIGKNSINAMRSGVYSGTVLACEGFIDSFKNELKLPKDTKIVVSGGSAKELIPLFKNKVSYIPNLTLKGLNVIYSLNKR